MYQSNNILISTLKGPPRDKLPPKITLTVSALPRRTTPLCFHQPRTIQPLILRVFHHDPRASALAQPTRLAACAPLGPLADLAVVDLLDGFVFLLPVEEGQLLQQTFALLVLELFHLLVGVIRSVVLVNLNVKCLICNWYFNAYKLATKLPS